MTAPCETRRSRLDQLRTATQSEHQAIESALGLGRADLTAARYRGLLLRFYGFYLPLEDDIRALGGWEAYGLDLAARSKTGLLKTDLVALGVDPSGVPLCVERPRPRTRAEAFGVLYVLEGATLGGQILSRHLQQTLGLGPVNGARFFHGYGSRTGEMWQSFRKALLACPMSAGEEAAMALAAVETFRTLREWCGQGAEGERK
ncbi:MAG: biliverdin-producing heme oxygenase [Myxococcales bacterium]